MPIIIHIIIAYGSGKKPKKIHWGKSPDPTYFCAIMNSLSIKNPAWGNRRLDMPDRICRSASAGKTRRVQSFGRASGCKALTFSSHVFVCTLIKKLNQVAAHQRFIQRNLKSVASTLNRRFRPSRRSKTELDDESSSAADLFESEDMSHLQEESVPQQLWDEMFDGALGAMGDLSDEIFGETKDQK